MIYFNNENLTPATDCVVIRITDSDTLASQSSGFVIGEESMRNMRVGFAQVLKLGSEAKERTGLSEGSWVYYDKLSTFYHTEPIAVLRYNGLIMETNKEKTKYRALEGRVIVQESKESEDSNNVFVIPTSKEMKIGIIKSITPPFDGTKEVPFSVGDRILLTKDECDELHGFTGDKDLDPSLPIYIYKTENIICKIHEGGLQ